MQQTARGEMDASPRVNKCTESIQFLQEKYLFDSFAVVFPFPTRIESAGRCVRCTVYAVDRSSVNLYISC